MNKNQMLRIVNAIMALDFLIIAFTAITHDIWLNLGIYEFIHAIPGFIFLGLALVHLFLNREWIRKNYFKK